MPLYEDPEFPRHSVSSLSSCKIVWRRPNAIVRTPKFFGCDDSLITSEQHIERRKEIRGNRSAFFLMTVAGLTNNVDKFSQVVPRQTFGNEYTGKFLFNFFENGAKTTVTIDDLLPTLETGTLLFSDCVGDAFWFPLLEKAYAKFCGGYDQINTGLPLYALRHLTGKEVECIDNENGGSLPFSPHGMYEKLAHWSSKKCLIVCKLNDNRHFNNEKHGSGFTVTGVQEGKRPSNDGIFSQKKFVKLRHSSGIIEKGLADEMGISEIDENGEGLMDVEKFVRQMQCVYSVDVEMESLGRNDGLDAFAPFIPIIQRSDVVSKHRCRRH
ncbi:unnamed protein product [Caenorhabditis sp. 36 PRJEB53466]|nr:unnamed protein product [Caenorhabditis sp. 36 PRJEB53466]